MGSVFALLADIYRTDAENGRPGKKILLQKAVQITTPADVEQFVPEAGVLKKLSLAGSVSLTKVWFGVSRL